MGNIHLFISNASGYFTDDDISVIEKASRAAQSYIHKGFPFDYDIDLIITAPSSLISSIPEDGIGGRTYNSRLLILVINTEEAEIKEDIIFEFLCHELSHSLRWEKLPEYANTLFENIIFEGLGVVLEEKALKDTGRHDQQFFLTEMQKTSEETIEKLISRLKKDFDSDTYDYDKLFFTGDETLPRWAAYRLGYYFVKKNLQESGMTIHEAILASYKKFKYDFPQ